MSAATAISTDIGKKKSTCYAIHFYWIELNNQCNWYEKSIQLTASSWHQIFHSSWLYICISIRIFQLIWNVCDCFFHCAAWVIIWALLVRRFNNCVYRQFPPHFTLVINHLKHQFNQNLSTLLLIILLQIQPIHLDWSPSLHGSFAVLHVALLEWIWWNPIPLMLFARLVSLMEINLKVSKVLKRFC